MELANEKKETAQDAYNAEREEWRARRREQQTQIDELKAAVQSKENELAKEKAANQDCSLAINRLNTEIAILRNQHTDFNSERAFMAGEIDRYRQENSEMRGRIQGMEFAFSLLGGRERGGEL